MKSVSEGQNKTTVFPQKFRRGIPKRLQQRFWAWIDARRPASKTHRLDRNSLFIFPSRQGLWFLALDVMLWLVGTNYENNLVLALAFLLLTLFIVSILHTFANLSGITIQLQGAKPVFSGETAEVSLFVSREGSRGRDNIQFRWSQGDTVLMSLLDNTEEKIQVFSPTQGRGWFNPGKLVVETYFPLGIIRCWTVLNMDCSILVYPQPHKASMLPKTVSNLEEGEISCSQGSDEFSGYREYQQGDSLKNVAWKHYARGLGIHSKEYSAYVDHRVWLEWDSLGNIGVEEKLSRLCYWVLEISKTDKEFGLRLPGIEIPPAAGKEHELRLLKTLALFQK